MQCNITTEILIGIDRKQCGKRRKCWLPTFSPFPTMLSTGFFFRVIKSRDFVVKVSTRSACPVGATDMGQNHSQSKFSLCQRTNLHYDSFSLVISVYSSSLPCPSEQRPQKTVSCYRG